MFYIAMFIAGLVLMIVGAEMLVRGASRLAVMVGISPLVVGLTVVAFGTSAPEFAVSIKAALSGQADLTVGNVVGSNIFNILFILGLSAIVTPLIVASQLIRFDVPLVIGVSVLVLVMAIDGVFSRIDGVLLFAGLVAYTGGLIYYSRRKGKEAIPPEVAELVDNVDQKSPLVRGIISLVLVAIGLFMLAQGSSWLVDSAVVFAKYLKISEVVIGLTVISIGTSLPEVVTSVIASLRNQRDIAVGNVIGSNLFNLLGVLGLAAAVSPSGIAVSSQVMWFDLPVMVAVAIAAMPIFITGGAIFRIEGAMLLAYYVAYTTYLVMFATQHEGLDSFRQAMFYFAIPLTVVTMTVLLVQDMRRRRAAALGSHPSETEQTA
jgi:cation:H+ antiporter